MCLKESVVPNTFVLPKKLNRLTGETRGKVRNLLTNTSREMMKMSLGDVSRERERSEKKGA